ncbi:MAG TPA: hypothetical protein DDW27_17535 [Bacteroidales bacterium]|nr:hypothetical protein [Bacteroidales bacterium]
MAKRLISILILTIFYILNCYSQVESSDDLLRKTVAGDGQVRITIPFQGNRQLNDLSRNLSVSSVKNKKIEIVLSPLTVEWFISQNIKYEILNKPDPASFLTSVSKNQLAEWERYPTYTEYDSIMQSFPVLYPSICDIDTIGTSINGRLVLVLKISDNVSVDEDEPEVFFSSTIHGDETAGYILMLRLADYLLKNYNTNYRIRNLVDNLEIWINPLANPDGTYRTGNTITSPVRFNASGYDLNRNFPDPATPNTVKQKETLDMVKFLRKRRFVLSANFHSGAEVVNFPWDSRWWLHADDEWFYKISRKYADTVHIYSPAGYMTFLDNGVTNGYDWYSINGGRQDFITWELQGREVTIELHDEYVTPESKLDAMWQYNYRSLLGYIENALYGIRGIVKDRDTGDPVAARIFVTGHDKDSSHVYSDSFTGSFTRMLSPGEWNLKFSARGYLDKEIENIVAGEDELTLLTVEMEPYLNPVDTADTPGLIIYPNPSEEQITLVLPERQFGKVNIMIFNSLGIKMVDINKKAVEDIPIRIDISDLEGGVYILQVRNSTSRMTDRALFMVVRR